MEGEEVLLEVFCILLGSHFVCARSSFFADAPVRFMQKRHVDLVGERGECACPLILSGREGACLH